MMKCHETRGPTTCSSNECICSLVEDMKMRKLRAISLLNDNATQMRLPWLRVGFLKGVQGLRWDATLYHCPVL